MSQPPRSPDPQDPQPPAEGPAPRSAPSRALVVCVLLVLVLVFALIGFFGAPLFMAEAAGGGEQSSAPYAQGYGTGTGLSHRL